MEGGLKKGNEWLDLMRDEMAKCNYETAKKCLFKVINNEDVDVGNDDKKYIGEALWLAGHHYKNGTMLFRRDKTKARDFYRRSAELGHPMGMCSHGKRHWYNEQNEWNTKVLETDDDLAKGMCYATCMSNIYLLPKKALDYLLKSSTSAFSQNQLGHYYTSLVNSDYYTTLFDHAKEAFEWHLKAAQQGHYESQLRVGYCFLNGIGVPKNLLLSWKWHMKAVKQNINEEYDTWRVYGYIVLRENTRRAFFYLLYIHKHKLSNCILFSQTPIDVIKLVIHEIWKTRHSWSWDFGEDDLIK